MRTPDKLLGLQWMKKAWDSVTADMIVNLFKLCSISVEKDDSKDNLVHCIKPGSMVADAAAAISAKTATLLCIVNQHDTDTDLFPVMKISRTMKLLEDNE